MADWRRIQGSIRKARTSKDPATALADLYNSSRDAMVAFELAQFHEKNGSHADAAQWYTTAASRFRRAQWKVKAQEALTRLGVTVPLPEAEAEELAQEPGGRQIQSRHHSYVAPSEPTEIVEEVTEVVEMEAGPDEATQESRRVVSESPEELDVLPAIATPPASDADKKRRRRGRRGGVRHRKRREAAGAKSQGAAPQHRPVQTQPTATSAPVPAEGVAEETNALPPAPAEETRPQGRGAHQRGRHGESRPQRGARSAPPKIAAQAQPQDDGQDTTRIGPAAYQERQRRADEARLRTAEPALASRLAKLESQLRRLVAAPAHAIDDVVGAPAGPGVFLLSDSDLIDNYYVEACQTLRIGAGNMSRGGRTRDGGNIRELLASYLGIPEARVAKYLKEHCSVRWLQLDEGAPLLAHFATAVLQPTLNVMEA